MTRPILVGLTGGLASGKSTVAGLLAERGCRVVDADQLVATLYRPGEPGAAAIRERFGEAVLTAEGGVDHPALAARVFHDPQARRQVEETIHPLVRERFRQIAEAASEDVVVLEATLLVEAGYAAGEIPTEHVRAIARVVGIGGVKYADLSKNRRLMELMTSRPPLQGPAASVAGRAGGHQRANRRDAAASKRGERAAGGPVGRASRRDTAGVAALAGGGAGHAPARAGPASHPARGG